MSTDTPAAATAEPMDSCSPEDRAFYRFWYGHMLNDLMQPPLAGISHATARYIWNAALSAPVAAQDMNQCDGCKQGADLRNGLHYDRHGKAFMGCQRDKYAAPVAAQPAASGVDALWVDEAMKLAKLSESAYLRDFNYQGDDQKRIAENWAAYEAARDALRTHLSTALTGAAKDVK